MKSIRRFLQVTLMGVLLAVATTASAGWTVTSSALTQHFQILFNQDLGGGNALSATVNFDVTSYSNSTIVFAMTISNTSNVAAAGITSFGLDLTPVPTGVSVSSGALSWGASLDALPSLSNIDVCVFANGACGNPSNALGAGSSDSLTLTLSGNFANGLTFLGSGMRFVRGDASNVVAGNEPTCTIAGARCTPNNLPEPPALALFALALLGLAGVSRLANRKG